MGHMPKRSWIFLALAFLPFLIGIVISLLAPGIWSPVPVLVFKIDIGMVIFVAGILLSLYLLAFWIG
jgi:hypothetical protein